MNATDTMLTDSIIPTKLGAAKIDGVMRDNGEGSRWLCTVQFFGTSGEPVNRHAFVWVDTSGANPSKPFNLHRL